MSDRGEVLPGDSLYVPKHAERVAREFKAGKSMSQLADEHRVDVAVIEQMIREQLRFGIR